MEKPGRAVQLQYLEAFEASARHASFKAAAEELHVTASAVGQQIKSLEKHLGLDLFIRKTRKIELTSAGESYYKVAANALANFDQGLEEFSQQYYSSTLKISMSPVIAHEIVIPRLHEFQSANPQLNLIIETSMEIQDLIGTNLDCSIRCGVPPWESCNAEMISKMESNIIASKEYLDRNPVASLEELEGHSLIHFRDNGREWQTIRSVFKFNPGNELFLGDYPSSIKAAEQGLGVAMGFFPVLNKIVEDGKLVAILPNSISTGMSYYFVSKANELKQKNYDLLCAWLKDIFPKL